LEYNKNLGEYKKIKAQTELKLAEIKSRQEAVQEQLLPDVNKLYLEAEKRFPVSFVAKLYKESCTGCHIGISSNLVKRVKEGKTIQHCDNCGRILIN
jgi:predicted  nucleic acid-binding Zn-ribbon protein